MTGNSKRTKPISAIDAHHWLSRKCPTLDDINAALKGLKKVLSGDDAASHPDLERTIQVMCCAIDDLEAESPVTSHLELFEEGELDTKQPDSTATHVQDTELKIDTSSLTPDVNPDDMVKLSRKEKHEKFMEMKRTLAGLNATRTESLTSSTAH